LFDSKIDEENVSTIKKIKEWERMWKKDKGSE